MHFLTAVSPFLAALAVSGSPLVARHHARQNYEGIDSGAESGAELECEPPVTYVVDVGKNNLTFTPSQITAKIGDYVQFNFYAKNHTVVQSTFENPCFPAEDALFTGFQPTNITKDTTGLVSIKTATFEVGTTDPLWFYCAQGSHCQAKMTFAVNPPEGGVEEYNLAASNATQNVAPSGEPAHVLEGVQVVFLGTPTSSEKPASSQPAYRRA